ncbi:unnamed protein product, partial [Ectocarpus sp. 12 AP-2014]
PTTLRRRVERGEKKDPLKEKRVQLQPAVAKEVQSFITAKRKEARGMVLGRFDAEQRGLMTDSGAVEDSLLEGFDKPWPRPRYAAASAAGPVEKDGGAADVVGEGRRSPSKSSSSPAAAAAAEAAAKQRLALPEGVLLKHAVQVWNALCVFPRPMGLRPPPTLDQLMRAIVMVSPRWQQSRGAEGSGEESKTEEGGGEEDGEAEFDEKKAFIRAAA